MQADLVDFTNEYLPKWQSFKIKWWKIVFIVKNDVQGMVKWTKRKLNDYKIGEKLNYLL